MEYKNYYIGENEWALFEFEGLTKEESLRIQAYLLKDNDIYINDPDSLNKISEQHKEISMEKGYSASCIYIRKKQNDQGHYVLSGYKKIVDSVGGINGYNLSANIFEGLNFISMVCTLEDRETMSHKMSSTCWCYEKSYKPDKLIRYNTVKSLTSEEHDVFEYTVNDDFSIESNPTEIFKQNKKEIKSLIKTK